MTAAAPVALTPAPPRGELVLEQLGEPQLLTVDGHTLYWIDAVSRPLYRWAPGDGGAPQRVKTEGLTLASLPCGSGIAVQDDHLYIAPAAERGVTTIMAKQGNAARVSFHWLASRSRSRLAERECAGGGGSLGARPTAHPLHRSHRRGQRRSHSRRHVRCTGHVVRRATLDLGGSIRRVQ